MTNILLLKTDFFLNLHLKITGFIVLLIDWMSVCLTLRVISLSI